MRRLFFAAMLAISSLYAAGLAGKWKGSVNRPDGTPEAGVIMELKQEGDTVTGRIGTSEGEMAPMQKVQRDGDKLTFEVPSGNALYKVALTAAENTMKGSVIRSVDGVDGSPLPMELKRAE